MSIEINQGNMRKLADLIVERLADAGVFQNCTNCREWNKEQELCNKFKQRPPAHIIVKGCSEHSDNIPF